MSARKEFEDVELPEAPADAQRFLNGDVDAHAGAVEYPGPSQPYKVAQQVMRELYSDTDGVPTLTYWRGDWWMYSGTHWEAVSGSAKDADLVIAGQLLKVFDSAVYSKKESNTVTLVPWSPNRSKISEIIFALKPLAYAVVSDTDDAPCFLRDCAQLPGAPGEYVSMSNGLLRWSTRELVGHTPRVFTTYSLPFAYDPQATAPVWEKFLKQIFAHDTAAIDTLQEYLGYVISGRTDLHKALLIVGPTRAGKGTILRVLRQLVGQQNVTDTSLHSLGSDSGPAELIGKPLAIIGDARDARAGNSNRATELLLNVIGEDGVSLQRKYLGDWVGRLPTRFALASNVIPRLIDSSAAVVGRFVMMRLEQSFAGQEDEELGAKLAAELPGILNWALDGLERLEQQGRFTEPATMAEMKDAMEGLSAPVRRFIEEYLEVTGNPADIVPRRDVYSHWRTWHADNGFTPCNQEEMCNRLTATDGRIRAKQLDVPGAKPKPGQKRPPRERYILGVKLVKSAF
ncbi:DNA primase family protein [Corynebacterium tuberculostearicum]|uniref:Phage/plasmid primase, P4 family domain protein n=1 Tax=Corynebacterium tuberculostearicum SK141 TaxID=553206 RepID=C6R6G0_9CORY|nr:phage/plasmid primase, P4 family [Corynebacterium tuberculostearicum]EET78236.1 phage/plasmid primase, P4 family domain protein [Corynebacterium tuberculostearicum SK141]